MKKITTPRELREEREAIPVSQLYVSRKAGMTQGNYCKIENGKQKATEPQYQMFESIIAQARKELEALRALGEDAPAEMTADIKSPLAWVSPGAVLLIILITLSTLAPDLDQGVLAGLGAKSFSEVQISYTAIFIFLIVALFTMWLFVITVNAIWGLFARMSRSVRRAFVSSRLAVYVKASSNKPKH